MKTNMKIMSFKKPWMIITADGRCSPGWSIWICGGRYKYIV